MKSRKPDQLRKKSKDKQAKRKETRNALRAVESLEDRRLMTITPWIDGLYYPETALATSRLNISQLEYRERIEATNGSGANGSGGGNTGEGSGGARFSEGDLEPNNSLAQAQFIPIGTGAGENRGATIVASTTAGALDTDYFTFNLRAGDILDVALVSAFANWDVSLRDASGTEIAGNADQNTGGFYPASSPLRADAQTGLAIVIPQTGQYFLRVANGPGPYTVDLDVFRPVLEQEPVGTKQILYLDFDGAEVPLETFIPGVAPSLRRLSPLSDFLAGWNLGPADENAVIDSIIDNVAFRFTGTIPSVGGNGHYSSTGRAGEFDIEIRNSRDHADPWLEPNVSRVVVGGTAAELGIGGIYGIAQSIDIGNFDTTETGVVLLDLLSTPAVAAPGVALSVNQIPISGEKTKIDLIGEIVGNIVAHEAGHYLGNWHQQNSPYFTMSTGLGVEQDAAVGPDGVYGSPDDVARVTFGDGRYDPTAGAIQFGTSFSTANIAWGLATGTAGGGTITGSVFQDRNSNGILDSADIGFGSVQVYADANGNGVFDSGEFQAFSDAAGNYQIDLPAGTYTIRETIPDGYRLTTPVDNAHVVTLAAGAVVGGRNFGNDALNLDITGFKFNDINGNGLRDAGEPGIEGVWFYLDLDGDNDIDIHEPATQSDVNGNYRLEFPGPGTYQVREIVTGGFVQTFPGVSDDGNPLNDFEHEVVLTGDPAIDQFRVAGLDFGNRLTVDFGDAALSYGEAAHGFVDGLILGALWDAEQTSQFSATATGDDVLNVDDEDGIVLTRPLVAGSTNNRVAVTAINSTGTPGYLQGWVDFNQDGVFSTTEQVISNQVIATGTSSVTFSAPSSALLGDTSARFRFSHDMNVGPTGRIDSGEVEDYVFNIVDTLDLAVNDNFTVQRNSALNEFDVLANDFRLAGETLSVVSVSGSSAGATVQISPSNTVLYTPPAGFIGQDVFTYTMRNSGGDVDTASVVVDVILSFDNPLAIDDSFDLPTNSVDFPLNILANDIEGQNGALSIISVTQPDKGGQIVIATGGKSLRYTPPRDFGGTEFFTYTVADSAGNQASAQVTLHTLPGDRTDDLVEIRLETTDLSGNPITAIQQGDQFQVRMSVDDLRSSGSMPGIDAGVFAAYTDLLYDFQLVSASTDTSGNLLVSYFNDYTNGQTGDGAIPGIVDEFGAFTSRSAMNENDSILLGAITFTARSPGIAQFKPDPADDRPAHDTLLFNTPASPVALEQISYLATSIEVVADGAEFPVAVDDSVPGSIPAGSVAFGIDVMANDIPGSTGVISLVSVENGTSGLTAIDTRGTADTSDDIVTYTPNGGFVGLDQFRYTIQDSRGIQSSATVTVRVGDAAANDIVSLDLQVTDLSGTPITQVTVGSQFQLRGYVDDLRAFGNGIFAAYQDVLYSPTLVSPVASTTNDPNLGFQVEFGPNYQRVREGDIRTTGLINEFGAVQTPDTPLGSDRQLLFTVTMTANALGTANFIGDPADVIPDHDTLTFDPPAPVPFDQIRYGFSSVEVVSSGSAGGGENSFHNARLAFDVNDDGHITPIDALGVINQLNNDGSGELPDGGGEGEHGNKLYVDTNDDGWLSPVDALGVINYLNNNSAGGEGEGLLLAMLGGGAAESSSDMPTADVSVEAGDSGLGNSDSGVIGSRLTGYEYGPQSPFTGSDSILEDDDDNMEDLIGQLAFDIEGGWNNDLS